MVQTALRAVYPAGCLLCRDSVESAFGLCGACWGQMPFVAGTVCDRCGVPQPPDLGVADALEDTSPAPILCDACLEAPTAWHRGRAALAYSGAARRLVLALKHGDRPDVARPAATWMARAAAPLLCEGLLVAPVPLHWTRLLKRRYNQSALLSRTLAAAIDRPVCPDLLQRVRRTPMLADLDDAGRRAAVAGALRVAPRRRSRIAGGRPVLLVDDVLTSGATLNACASVLAEAGAGPVSIIVLARAARGP